MATLLLMRVNRLLIQAVKSKLVEFNARVVSDRVREAIRRAEAAGFQFVSEIKATSSLPYLVVFISCTAAYSKEMFPVELRIWDDGIVQLLVRPDEDSDKSLFVVRILADGFVSQTMNFHKYLHS